MDSSAELEREARELISTIREKHTTVGYEELAVILSDLLDLAASDLYDTSTHFLLELLQNADDNQYPLLSVPTLAFTCRESTGSLRVDCNETGFEAKHVKAISTVRRSTKSNKNHSGGYTGEKGIGFKSVFRVAERVWISSRQYRFMFDKKERFGMIAPKWAEFPEAVLPAQTSFYLELSEANASEDLTKELRNFDATLLVFLRRIRQVVLRIHGKDNKRWEKHLRKTLVLEDGEAVTIVDVDQSQLRYRTFTYQVENLPFEEKRPESRTSELTLAFPTSSFPAQPSRGPRYVHALLPFLLNGDFLLTADRSHIDVSSPWNQSLRSGLAAAFVQAVQKFSQGSMKYFWPFFVPNSQVSSFFQPSREMILQDLAERAVLEGWDGTMLRPSNLIYVSPSKYADEDKRPFTLHQHTISRYLSIKYPEWLIDSLLDLGVRSMSDEILLNDLASMVSNYPGQVRRRPPTWHSQLAKVLLPLAQVASHKETLATLAIIPLSDGTWTSADQQPVFFSEDLDLKSFGVLNEILIIDPVAAADDNRRGLFQKLGISEIDRPDMCFKIAKLHASTSFNPQRITRTNLISHATFLFQASWSPDFDVDLWFATSDGGVCRGSELYIRGDFEDGSPSARVFDKLRKEFPTAHKDYLSRITSASPYKKYPDTIYCDTDTPEELGLDGTSNNELHFSDTAEDLNQKSATVTIVDTSTSDMFTFDSVYEARAVDTRQPATSTKSNAQRHFSLLDESYFENLIVKEKQSFRSYLISTLHLSEIPRLVRESIGVAKQSYFLSEEFKFLFKECPVSDVLYLLSEHWNIYSEWIEMSSSKRQDPNIVDSNKKLLNDIADSIVRTLHGLSPIRNTVLPSLDPRIMELQIPIPILDIDGSEDQSLRRKLGCLGIKVDADIHYYLSCLASLGLQQGSPDDDAILYIYEQIQYRYEDNEEAVQNLFDRNAFIYTGPAQSSSRKSHSWLTIAECRRRKIDLGAIYPTCKGFFLWLVDVDTFEIDVVVAKAASIGPSWTLPRILEVFAELSCALRPMSPAAARRSVRPLRGKAIFPVNRSNQMASYVFRSSEDTSWFIADRPHLVGSFAGKVPLLALAAEEIESISPLLVAMGLHTRQLNGIVERTYYPLGNPMVSSSDAQFFHARLAFVKALVPKSEKDIDSIYRQLHTITINVTESIFQVYTIRYKGEFKCASHTTECEAALIPCQTQDTLTIYIAKKNYIHRQLPFELIDMIAAHCRITDHRSSSLLYAALREPNTRKVRNMFAANGYYLDSLDEENTESQANETEMRYQSRSDDSLAITRPIWHVGDGGDEDKQQGRDRRRWLTEERHEDRRIPLMSFSQLGTTIIEDPVHEQGLLFMSHSLDPSQHIEYLGQKLVSSYLVTNRAPQTVKHMGSSYDPIIHWTSVLRARAGLPSFTAEDQLAPFTMSDPLASMCVTDLMLSLGKLPVGAGDAAAWRGRLPRYHFEIAASEGDMDSTFVWTWWQLRRIQKFRFRETLRRHFDVAVLVRISSVFEDPQFCFIIDPWHLVVFDRLRLTGNVKSLATIEDIASVADFQDLGKLHDALRHNETEDAGLVTLPYHQAPWAHRLAAKGRDHDSKFTDDPDLVVGKQSDRIASPLSMSSKVHLPFSHQKLGVNHIRLFMLFPGESRNPLTGMIFECSSIEDSGPYRTLSYEWGPNNTATRHRLWTADGFMGLGDSLNAALRRLRHKTSPTVLWVDAICIDQANEDEKAKQIRMLPRIFQTATRTMAFLGSSTQSDSAIETLLQITAKEAYDSASGNNWPEGLSPVPLSWAERSTPRLDDPIWRSIAKFFESTWFRRVWIVQEVVISPRISIVCGNWTVNWNDIYRAMDLVEQEQGSSLGAWSSSWQPFMTLSYLRVHEAYHQRYELLTLLDTFRHVDSTLRRDRYFALLGLAYDGNEKEFEPDYRKSTTFEEIACRFGRGFVKGGRGMDLLYRAGLGPNSDRFPSWLPDLTVPGTSTLHDREVDYNASGDLEEWIEWLNGNVLAIDGCHVDEIVSISKHSNSNKGKERAQYFKEVDSMVDSLRQFYTPERLEELKWQVPVAGALRPTAVALVDLSMHDSYKAFREVLRKAEFKRGKAHKYVQQPELDAGVINGPLGEGATRREKSAAYSSLLNGSICGWKFVTTKRNRCGIVPGTAQIGDRVSILSGGNIPFLLRKSRTRAYCYSLVGGCYIDGIMQGEAVEFPGFKEKTIHVC
ncbi:hypothetical protein F5Y00DRAFT_261400 [Daldinia vernicosa]|uniref:uncharacterized protein n=1 Tax=Daldinia vernicosa TaxID=114800 RepID=UPI0020079C6F|nr:uncharacterized protein F5Y00DRAFT_261400 [Daldinia vernicosa]KAI0849615.1 hypothetical protein F5Y00DRAFT_261400 [Daldinia vernicosa]